MTDERHGLPSASKWGIVEDCPGSENLLREIGDQLPKDEGYDPDAERGTQLHAAWQAGTSDGLLEEDVEIFEMGQKLKEQAVEKWMDDNKIIHCNEGDRELRLWLMDNDLNPISSGQMDCHFTGWDDEGNDYVLILDFKSLWCRHLAAASQNRQLKKLVALYSANLTRDESMRLLKIRAALLKPMVGGNKIDAVDYSREDIEYARREVFFRAWMSKQPDAQRIPGPHCYFCKAKDWCVEAGAFSMLPAAIAPNALEAVKYMSPQDLSVIQEKAPSIQKILDAVKKRMKELPTDELNALGWRIADGAKKNTINTIPACDALNEALLKKGVNLDLRSAMSFKKEQLVDIVSEALGDTKKATKIWIFDNVVEPYIDKFSRNEGSLERIK